MADNSTSVAKFHTDAAHPACPATHPHGVVHTGSDQLMACARDDDGAQDLALQLDYSDVDTGGQLVAAARIVLAATGTDTGTEAPEVVLGSWPDVELVAVGEWNLSTGPASFTTADLQNAVGAADCPAVGPPVLKLGHTDDRFPILDPDGEPAVGWISNMQLNASMTKVTGDYTGMPGWLGAILPSAYPKRSIEGSWNFPCQNGHIHPFVITAVALLGTTPPGVGMIGSLNDVAALYGIQAARPAQPETAHPFTLELPGVDMPPDGSTVLAAGTTTTVDDVRRAYYEDAPWSMWIIEIQFAASGPVLIVSDDNDGALYRVPVTLNPDNPQTVGFGDPTAVLVQYVDAPPSEAAAAAAARRQVFPAGRKIAARWEDRNSSRPADARGAAIASHTTGTSTGTWSGSSNEAHLPAGDDVTAAKLRPAFAWSDPDGDAATKADYKFIHHFVASDGTIGDASTVACSAGIGVLNGGRSGADIPDADMQGVYNHLAKHLRDADLEPPELSAGDADAAAGAKDGQDHQPASGDQARVGNADEGLGNTGDQGEQPGGEPGPEQVEAAGNHGAYDGTHSHTHSAFGSQGDDATHDHSHTHSGDAVHNHVHEPMSAASSANATRGAPDVEFTDDQLAAMRLKLGIAEGEDITADQIASAFAKAPEASTDTVLDTSNPPPDGTYLVDGDIIKGWQARAAAGDNAVKELGRLQRDSVLDDAIRAGKFPQARRDHYAKMWERDPDGTRTHIEHLAAGLVPMSPTGTPGFDPEQPGDFEGQQAYDKLYGPDEARRAAQAGAASNGGAYRG